MNYAVNKYKLCMRKYVLYMNHAQVQTIQTYTQMHVDGFFLVFLPLQCPRTLSLDVSFKPKLLICNC